MDRSTLEALPAVNVEVNGQAAALLVKLMGDLKTDQPMAVLTRALGVLEQAIAAKAQGAAPGRLRSRDGALHGSGDLMASANRSRPPPLPRHRAREDQAGPAQVHLAGRADRAQGEGSGLDPAAADQRPALPVRQQGPGRGGAGGGGRRRQPRQGRSQRRRQRQGGRSGGRARAGGRAVAGGAGADHGRGAAAPPHRAQGQAADHRPEGPLRRHPARRARSRCATSSAPSVRRCAGRS